MRSDIPVTPGDANLFVLLANAGYEKGAIVLSGHRPAAGSIRQSIPALLNKRLRRLLR
ncbi:MAG: hypothetical protein Q8R44_01745 [Novosphingobium sp.]|nr:hypothetical protein [Novosphingobium sp.]